MLTVGGSYDLNVFQIIYRKLQSVFCKVWLDTADILLEDNVAPVLVSDIYSMNTVMGYCIGILVLTLYLVLCYPHNKVVLDLTVGIVVPLCYQDVLYVIYVMHSNLNALACDKGNGCGGCYIKITETEECVKTKDFDIKVLDVSDRRIVKIRFEVLEEDED